MRWLDWFFRDRAANRIVVAQWPNWSLGLFAAAALVAWAAGPGGSIASWARMASLLFLFVWAADELVRGVNPWRRCLGGAVLLWMLTRALA